MERMRHLLSLFDEEKEEEMVMRDKTRAKKLHQAALKGTLNSLLELVQEDPLILSTTTPPSSIPDTPLHVAVFLGHLEFARELLSRKPELAGALNSQGSSPLHVASAKGYVEIVKELLLVDPDMCFVLEHDGRSPLHLASIKGRVGVLTELIRVKPEAALVLTSGGETCLHLCVKYNRLAALNVLLLTECVKKDEFVNWKDDDGNTILHVAVANKQIEMIKYLLTTTGIEVNSGNANGLTALDVLSQSPRDLRDMEIKECLHGGCGGGHGSGGGRAMRIRNTPSIIVEKSPSTAKPQNSIIKQQAKKHKHKHTDWLGSKRSALMVVASLIATVAFQAAISPPGGVWQNSELVDSNGNPVENPHVVGKSVMAYNIPQAYGQFMIFDTIAFLASLSIILLLISGLPLKRRRWMWIQMVTMWIAITAQTITYFLTLIHMSPKEVEGVLYHVTEISVLSWLSIMGIVFIGNVIRMTLWLLRRYGYIKEKETNPPPNDKEDDDDLRE